MIRPAAITQVEIRLVQDDVEGAERLWHDLGLEQDPMSGRASVGTRQTRARVRAATGRHEEALQEFLASRAMEDAWGVRTPAHSTWRSDAVRLLTTLDRVDEALALAEEDVARARRFGEPRALGMALRSAGLASKDLERLSESVAVLRAVARAARARALAVRARRGVAARRAAGGRARAAAGRRSTSPPSAGRPPSRRAPTTSSSPPARAPAATRSRAAAG